MGSRHSAPDPALALPSTAAADIPSLLNTPFVSMGLWFAQTFSEVETCLVGELNPNGDARKVDLSHATIMFAHPDGRPPKEMTVAEFILGVNEGLDDAAKTVQQKADLYRQYLGGMVFDNSTRFTDPPDLTIENAIRSLLHKSGVTTSYRDGAFKIDKVGLNESKNDEQLAPAPKQLAAAPDDRYLPGFTPAGLLPGGPDEASGGAVVTGRRPGGSGGSPAEEDIALDCSAAQYAQLIKLYCEETVGVSLPRAPLTLEDDGSQDLSYYAGGVTIDVQAVEIVDQEQQLSEQSGDVRTQSGEILEAERNLLADLEFPPNSAVLASPVPEDVLRFGGAFTWTGPDGAQQVSIVIPGETTAVPEGVSVEPISKKLAAV